MTAIRTRTTRHTFFRPLPRFGPTILAGFASLVLLPPPAFGSFQPVDPSIADPLQSDAATPDNATTPVQRALDAFKADPASAEAEVTRLLRDPETAEGVLTGLSGLDRLPAGLWRPVSTCTTDEYPLPTRIAAIRLLPRFGSREAATRLVVLLNDPNQALHAPARQSLRELTGLGDSWDDGAWTAWGAESETWSDRAWNTALLAHQAARARSLAERQRGLSEELVSLYRRLHVELDAPGRTVLLAELIRDERSGVRDLGFDLAGRDLSARTQLGPEVASAAAARLTHPDPVTRARAATLVSRLVPPDAMLTLTRALQAETNPQAAEPMLLGVARWPSEGAVAPTVRWLERDDAPFGAVTTALWALAQNELLTDPGVRERILNNLRARDPARGGEPALKLLVRLGNEQDLAGVAAMLTSPEDPARNAAAGALAETRPGAALLIEAAAADPRLFSPAARAIGAHHLSPEGLRRLASLPVIDPATRDAAIAELAARLSPDDLAQAVRDADLGPALRETVLSRLADPDRDRTPGVVDALLLLAETRVDLRRPAEALVVLGSIDPGVLGETDAARWHRARLIATVISGDLDAADELETQTLDDWLTAWRQIPGSSEQRALVAERIIARFAPQLTPDVRAELGRGTAEPAGTTSASNADGSSPPSED